MDAPQNEYAATLGWQRLDDGFHLSQCLAGMKLGLDIIFAAQQFQIGDGFETDHLVAAGGVDDEVAGDGEQIGAARRHILPIFRGIGAGQYFRDHILQLMGRRQYSAEAATKGGFLWQDNRLEPVQFSANPMHVDPLILSAAPLQHFIFCLLDDIFQSWMQGPVQPRNSHFPAKDQNGSRDRKLIVDMLRQAHTCVSAILCRASALVSRAAAAVRRARCRAGRNPGRPG